MSARVLGIDPGSRWVGWARLHVERGRAHYLGAGVLDVEQLGAHGVASTLAGILATTEPPVETAVEVIAEVRGRGVLGAKRAGDLYRSGLVTGRILDRLGDVREVSADAVRARWIVMPGPREAATRREAGERMDIDGALLAVARREIEGWPAEICGFGSAYQKPTKKRLAALPRPLLAACLCHAVDAALVAMEAA